MGHSIGPYRLCLEVGAGGMATVFLASHMTHDGPRRFVALKCMHPTLVGEPEFVEMFEDEARISARIQHPNVCPVLDWGTSDGVYFLALPYLEGETMRSVRQRMTENGDPRDPMWHACVVARMIVDAGEGLHAAHELRDASGNPLDVVHRDVSPENIFVTYGGSVTVMDFGLVRARNQLHRTRTGIVKGKFAYLQPEVIEGKRPDRRADVWSLGVVLWEMLTRQRLFRRESDAATLKAITCEPIDAPSIAAPGLPPELDAIVMRALERDPDKRWPTTRELGRELMRFIGVQGLAVGMADVADTMAVLFPGGPTCARQRLMLAEQVEEASAALALERLPARGVAQQDPDATRALAARMRRRFGRGAASGTIKLGLMAIAGLVMLAGAVTVLASSWRGVADPVPPVADESMAAPARPPARVVGVPPAHEVQVAAPDPAVAVEVSEDLVLQVRLVPAEDQPVPAEAGP